MTDEEYFRLQQTHGGRYVARRGDEVIASAKTIGELSELLEAQDVDWTDVVIQYVDRADRVRVY